jgi:hypothetical protein
MPPGQMGDVAVTVTFMDEVTFITMPSGTEQPFTLTWVNVITAPVGQEAPRLTLDGPMLANPAAFITNVPLPPAEVVQDKVPLGVPVKLTVEDDPGQIVEDDVSVAAGRAFTVTTLEVLTAVVQGAAPELITLTNANVVLAVSAAELIVVVPPAPITTLCGVPPAV